MSTATATPPPVILSWHRTSKRWTLTAPASREVPSTLHPSQFYTFIVLQGEYDGQIGVFRHNTPTIPAEPYAVWTVQTARTLWNSCISCGWRIA